MSRKSRVGHLNFKRRMGKGLRNVVIV